jgi:hypothetical protein
MKSGMMIPGFMPRLPKAEILPANRRRIFFGLVLRTALSAAEIGTTHLEGRIPVARKRPLPVARSIRITPKPALADT